MQNGCAELLNRLGWKPQGKSADYLEYTQSSQEAAEWWEGAALLPPVSRIVLSGGVRVRRPPPRQELSSCLRCGSQNIGHRLGWEAAGQRLSLPVNSDLMV